jgi:hypothetical protein
LIALALLWVLIRINGPATQAGSEAQAVSEAGGIEGEAGQTWTCTEAVTNNIENLRY